jgi:hypothetical protein
MGSFGENDEVVQAVKRHRARQDADERKAAQAARDAEVADIFRPVLLDGFDPELLAICERSLLPSTTAAYDGELRRLDKWCKEFGISSLPISREAAGFYLAEQLEAGASYSAIKRAAAAISYHHCIRGLPDPCAGPDPNDLDADMYDVTPKPFVAAVLRRAHAQHKAKQESNNKGE